MWSAVLWDLMYIYIYIGRGTQMTLGQGDKGPRDVEQG